MFLSKQVLIGILGVPAGAAAEPYNWAFFAGGTTGTGDAGVTSNTRTYGLGDATWASEGALSTAVFNAGGFGDKTYGWIAGGYTGSTNATQNRKYTNTDGTSMTSVDGGTTSMSSQNGWKGSCNGTNGYLFGGTFVSNTRKYSISGSTWSAGTALAGANGWTASHNNATYALISGGYSGSANLSRQDRYQFSDDTRTTQTALSTARRELTATGTQDHSYLYCGTTTVVIDTIEKVSLTDGASATSFTNASSLRFAESAGSDTKGVFAGGQSGLPGSTLTTTREITYSSEDDSAGTALPTATAQMAAFSGIQVS